MSRSIVSILATGIWCILFTIAIAQPPLRVTPLTNIQTLFPTIGAHLSIDANFHQAAFKQLPGYPNCCPQYQSGEGIGTSVSAFFQLPLNSFLTAQLLGGLTFRSGVLKHIESNASVIQPDGTIQKAVTEYQLKNQITHLRFVPSLTLFPFDFPLSFHAGVEIGYILNGSFEEKEILLEPKNISFENGRPVRNEQSGQIPQLSRWLYGLSAGIGYTLPVSRTLRVTPQLRYTHQLNNILADSTWKIHSLQLSLALAIPLIPSPPPQPIPILRPDIQPVPLHIPELPTPPPPALQLSLEVYGIFNDGSREANPAIVLEEQELTESFPLLPSVFFPPDSTNLALTRQILLTPSQTAHFVPTALPADALTIYRHLLNIIGYRLRQHPQATIILNALTIPPTAGRTISRQTAIQRAEAIKHYLVKVWNIAPKRITIRIRRAAPPATTNPWYEDIWAELERVEISSRTEAITMPVQIRHVNRILSPPALLLVPRVTAEAGIQRFTLTAQLGTRDTTLVSVATSPDTIRWALQPSFFLHSNMDSLILTATVRDQQAQERSADLRLPFTSLTVDLKRRIGSKDTLIEKFSLILFEFDKAELGPRNLAIVESVVKQIRSNSQVMILGYTDRIGMRSYNKKLAEARCKEVRKALIAHGIHPQQISYQAIGSDQLLYNNDLPEGRSYSRTVQIIIKTPLTPE